MLGVHCHVMKAVINPQRALLGPQPLGVVCHMLPAGGDTAARCKLLRWPAASGGSHLRRPPAVRPSTTTTTTTNTPPKWTTCAPWCLPFTSPFVPTWATSSTAAIWSSFNSSHQLHLASAGIPFLVMIHVVLSQEGHVSLLFLLRPLLTRHPHPSKLPRIGNAVLAGPPKTSVRRKPSYGVVADPQPESKLFRRHLPVFVGRQKGGVDEANDCGCKREKLDLVSLAQSSKMRATIQPRATNKYSFRQNPPRHSCLNAALLCSEQPKLQVNQVAKDVCKPRECDSMWSDTVTQMGIRQLSRKLVSLCQTKASKELR